MKVYKKCEIQNCNTCEYAPDFETRVKCISCISPYKEIDDGLICGDLSSKLYYEDQSDIYKSCTKHSPENTCQKCEKIGDNFKCLECTANFVLYYSNTPPSCLDKNS